MRSAYLIMAHHQFGLLQKLLRLLDDKDNDFYIHIDKKAKDVDLEAIRQSVRLSSVCFTERISVSWGGIVRFIASCFCWKKRPLTAAMITTICSPAPICP